MTLPPLLRAMRPHQWTKNLLVPAAPIAAGVIDDRTVLVETLLAIVAFCLASSGTYLLNDARDVEADRAHPTKCRRPIAAGELSLRTGYVAGVGLLAAALALAFAVTVDLGITIVAYLALTTLYSFRLKHVPVVDIVTVAAGFVLRAVAGATATGVPISQWFFIATSAGALLMVTGKREAELSALGDGAGTTRPVLESYTATYLLMLRGVATTMVLIAYCLWAFESAADATAELWFQLSIVPFVLAVLRYALLIDQGEGAEPERLVLRDPIVLASGAAWAMIYGYGVYLA